MSRINPRDLPPDYRKQVNEKLSKRLSETRKESHLYDALCEAGEAHRAISIASHHDCLIVRGLNPMGAPRQNKSDAWRQRPVVLRYRAFRDQLRLAVSQCKNFPDDPIWLGVRAYIAFPKSYSKKKRRELAGQIHRIKPDADNIFKSCTDCLFDKDERIAKISCDKFWDDGAGCRIELFW